MKFLMNPKELTSLVASNMKDKKRKNSDEERKKEEKTATQAAAIESMVIPTLQKTKKYKYPVKSINEFIQKMLKKELTAILCKTLSQDDTEWAGVRKCFNTFYDKIYELLKEDELLSVNIDENMSEIIDFIIIRLYKQIFTQNKILSPQGYEVQAKIESLQWLQPLNFGLKLDTFNKQLWELAIKELQWIDRCLTPSSKQACISSCL
jgi:hypothetical protein